MVEAAAGSRNVNVNVSGPMEADSIVSRKQDISSLFLEETPDAKLKAGSHVARSFARASRRCNNQRVFSVRI